MLALLCGDLVALVAFPALMWVNKNAQEFDLLALIAYVTTPGVVYWAWGEPIATHFFLGWVFVTLVLSGFELIKRRHQQRR